MPGVQRLQFFLPESPWEAEQVNDRRLELLREQRATAPHGGGVIVIDDSGDRKDGTATAHVGRQWLGWLGKTGNGIVTVTTVWTDGRVYYPLHATPYTPAHHFARGRSDPSLVDAFPMTQHVECVAILEPVAKALDLRLYVHYVRCGCYGRYIDAGMTLMTPIGRLF